MDISLEAQLACAKRELRMRITLYPRFTQAGRMLKTTAEMELAAMQSIVRTLETLVQQEAAQLPLLQGGTA